MGNIIRDLHETHVITSARKRIAANEPHLEVASSEITNFTTNMKAPIKECKIYFNPVQEGAGIPSINNMRSIQGWNNIEVYKSGKNMFYTSRENRRELKSSTDYTDYTEIDGGIHTSTSKNAFATYIIKAKPNTQYTCSVKANKSNSSMQIRLYSLSSKVDLLVSGQFDILVNAKDAGLQYSQTFTTLDNTDYIGFGLYQGTDVRDVILSEMQIELGPNATLYEQYNGLTIPFSFPSEAGNVYGGYVDLVNGKLVKEYNIYTFTGVAADQLSYYDDITHNNRTHHIFYSAALDRIISTKSNEETYSNIAIPTTLYNWDTDALFYVGTPTNQIGLYIDSTYCNATVESFNQWLSTHPWTLVYKLANPIEYDINSQSLKTLRNINNIWSNANGDVKIKYWTR